MVERRVPLLTLHWVDYAIVALYLGAIVGLGVVSARRVKRDGKPDASSEFLLAGRRLSLPLLVGSLVSTWYGGLLGVTEIAFTDGLSSWLTQGIFWYAAYVVFAFVLAGRLQQSGIRTLPEHVGALYGNKAKFVVSVLNLINVIPIGYMLAIGLLVHLASGWPIWVGVLVGSAVTVTYSSVGGFRAVVYTDMLQFVVMFVSGGVLLAACVIKLGGTEYLTSHLPAAHLQPTGALGLQELAVWAIIAFSTLVDPNFYHRCYAASSPKQARRAILIAMVFWVTFDLCTVGAGLYARGIVAGGRCPSCLSAIGRSVAAVRLQRLICSRSSRNGYVDHRSRIAL